VEQQGFNDFTKAGFARLLKHFEDNTDDVVKLTRAFALANKAHKGQHGDEPFVNHAIRVALVVTEELQLRDSDIASAALLHDALAGTLPEEDVRSECGDRVASIARSTARQKDEPPDRHFARLAKEPREAKLIKIAESLDTARSMKHSSHRDKALRFKDEAQKYVVPLAEGADERLAFKLSVALYEIK
jgi:GTP pyrophosphokinase